MTCAHGTAADVTAEGDERHPYDRDKGILN